MKKVVLLGMNSPTGRVLEYSRGGSAGHRLFKLADMSPKEYEMAFERMNLVDGEWSDHIGSANGAMLWMKFKKEKRTVVALGERVWRCLGFSPLPWIGRIDDGATFYSIPHTSGRCLWYNDQRHRTMVRRLLKRLARQTESTDA
jgi:hypothetical protein